MSTQQTLSPEQMKAVIATLMAENDALKAAGSRKMSFKISEKGGISVSGLGRFPATFYREQWLRILDQDKALRAFIDANEAVLKTLGTWTKA